MRGVSGGIGGVEFAGGKNALSKPVFDLVSRGAISQIGREQGLKVYVITQGIQDALSIVLRLGSGCYGRAQVWHHYSATKLVRCVSDRICEHVTISQVNMPIIGTRNNQAVCG